MNTCPDCGVLPGTRHVVNCDVARCNLTGIQQHQCDCNRCLPTLWTGEYPGKAECREFGWFTAPDSEWGQREDLNRLASAAFQGMVQWDRTEERFVTT